MNVFPSGLDCRCRTFFVQRLRRSICCKLLLLFRLTFLGLLAFVSGRLLVHLYGPVLRPGLLNGNFVPSLPLLVCLFFSALWNSLLLRTRLREKLWGAAVGLGTILKHRVRIDLLRLNCTFPMNGFPSGLDGRCRTFFVQRLRRSIFCKLLLLFLLTFLGLLAFVSGRLLVHLYGPVLRPGFLNGNVVPFLPLLVCLFGSALWNSLLLRTRMPQSLWGAAVGLGTILKR